ncbi:hypothetical protein JIP62_06760 [Brevundimonas vitis]|uniref:Acyl-protein synthetase LuxE domain-containing protein n=1 Tax=Brevundimonas vitisensis TaxID=2800818 RepID=A0ABX7BQP7_9CAUL|nr:hypothetical protein [Brevundimonas vitisensis]QQQ19780.1 hypothetical protein JIP62_06760 [Brevundimonas vitisensis]
MSTRSELVDGAVHEDVFDRPWPDIEARQLEAARELFVERRDQIPVLRRRADDSGVTEIRTLDDLVPLLFAHTAYKSYPPSFVAQGRWDRLLQWMQTLSVAKVTDVDVEGVTDVDDWMERLRAAGHMVLATSGSGGKVSFLNHTREDAEKKRRHYRRMSGWPFVKADNSRVVFLTSPSRGPNSAIEAAQNSAAVWARPGEAHFLTDEPLRLADISASAALNQRMAEGTATPAEIEAAQAEARARGERMSAAMDVFVDKILAHRHEPIVVSALWAQHMSIIERARARGIPDGGFHPDSLVSAGGGLKGVALPADYREQVDRFYGKVIRNNAYGMTEMAQTCPKCQCGRYHRPPGLIWLLLDRDGERRLTADDGVDGVVEGRFAFLDLLYEGRWGGLISGDKVTIDFKDCPCGRPGPTILDTISRYAQAGESDHIGCAGTIDAYIRGAVAA